MKHKHYEHILAWAEGAKIQYLDGRNQWQDVYDNNPTWREAETYRVKPQQDPVILLEEVVFVGHRVDCYGNRMPYRRTETVNKAFKKGETFTLTMDIYQ